MKPSWVTGKDRNERRNYRLEAEERARKSTQLGKYAPPSLANPQLGSDRMIVVFAVVVWLVLLAALLVRLLRAR
jgi:hypothetical protein